MSDNDNHGTEEACDLLVIGTGASAMCAALTAAVAGLKVLMVEKEEHFGGASARSGGCLWMPNSRHAAEAGERDSRQAALDFIRNETGARFDARSAEAFIDRGPEMVDFVEANSPVKFGYLKGLPDYHCDTPGGSKTGRVLFPHNWNAGPLGPELKRLRPALRTGTFLGMQVGVNEAGFYLTAGRKLSSLAYVARRLLASCVDHLFHGRSMRLGSGNALIGGLASAAFSRGVRIWTSAPARRLLSEGGRVVGAEIDTPKGPIRVRATRGVVVGAGGFPHDSKRRAELFPTGATAPEVWGMFPYGNSGDGIRMAEAVGGRFDGNVRSPIALTPITRLQSGEGALETMPCFGNRGVPGVIAVTRDGRRFCNEGRSYHDFGMHLLAKTAGDPESVAWLVFDHRYLRRYGNGPVHPAPLPYKQHIKSGYLKAGATVRDLAVNAGIDPDGLEKSVARYNEFASQGTDPDFHRGSNPYDIALGDAEHRPNPCIGPLDNPPYYAIRVFAGCVGTFAGIRADEHSRALDEAGKPIDGLYVVGNDRYSITGGDYIAGGCTLGPGMTFGYLAAKHAIGRGA
jgi:succinate dehydrogenase/fumarate reductase flavoprotein subunit